MTVNVSDGLEYEVYMGILMPSVHCIAVQRYEENMI